MLKYFLIIDSWISPCPEKKNLIDSYVENQTFFIDKKYANKIFYILPHSNLTLPALLFKPIKYRTPTTFLLLIKNNLTRIHPVKLKGIGGKSDVLITESRVLLNKSGIKYYAFVSF